MKELITKTGRVIIAAGMSELGWSLLMRKEKEHLIAGAAITGLGAGVVGIGSLLNDEESEEELEELVDLDVE